MGHAHELGAVRADLRRPGFGVDLYELRVAQPVLVQLRLHEPERESGRPDLRHAHLAQEIGQRPDMIFVPVRQDDRSNAIAPLAQVLEVRQYEIDAEVLVAREREARVDDDDAALGLYDHHVLADLAQAAKRDETGRSGHKARPGRLQGRRRARGRCE
jgi:hypothetical protein